MEVWNKGKIELKIIQIIDETRDCYTLRMVGTEPVRFDYRPGQYISLHLEIDGRPVNRSYSISSSPGRPDVLELTIKRVENGLVSNWLRDNIKVGDILQARGPYGEFHLPENPREKLLFVSAGSGITPMLSMVRFLYDTGRLDHDIIFLHGARALGDRIASQELEYLAARYPRFDYRVSLSRHDDTDGSWEGLTGRLDGPAIIAQADDFRDRQIFCCGPEGMMESLRSELKASGFDLAANYFEESFGPHAEGKSTGSMTESAGEPAPAAPAGEASLKFTTSNVEVANPGQEFVLDLAEDNGVEIDFSCRSGFCGYCKVKLVSGKVEMDAHEALTEEDEANNLVLACMSRCQGPVEIEA